MTWIIVIHCIYATQYGGMDWYVAGPKTRYATEQACEADAIKLSLKASDKFCFLHKCKLSDEVLKRS